MSAHASRLLLVPPALLCTLLAACGGGGDGGSSASTESAYSSSASQDSAASTLVAADSTVAAEAALQTSQAVVATTTAGQPVNCPGGGTAQYQVTGTDDGVPSAGEVYSLTFDQCRGSTGAIAVSGSASLTITAYSPTEMGASIAFAQLTAALPLSTLVLDGGARLGTSVRYSRNGTVLDATLHTAFGVDSLSVTRTANGRARQYALSAVDLQQDTTVTGGSVTSTALQGTATISATGANGQFSATLEIQGGVSFVDSLPVSGQWTVLLPQTALSLTASAATVTINVDQGRDGSVDHSFSWPVGTWAGSAQ